MDVPAHALWTNIIWRFAKQSKKEALWAAFFGILPDLIAFGYRTVYFAFKYLILGQDLIYFTEDGNTYHFWATSGLKDIYTLYNYSHSLVIFIVVFIIITAIRRGKVWLPLLGYPLHILIDIPTHAAGFFPTPYLFPLHTPTVHGFAWANPYFLAANYLTILIVYIWFYKFYNKKKSTR